MSKNIHGKVRGRTLRINASEDIHSGNAEMDELEPEERELGGQKV